jgi:hypothetical protein
LWCFEGCRRRTETSRGLLWLRGPERLALEKSSQNLLVKSGRRQGQFVELPEKLLPTRAKEAQDIPPRAAAERLAPPSSKQVAKVCRVE